MISQSERPIISDILDAGFQCEPASNGGWVIWENRKDNYMQRTMIAAYTNKTEMVKGIAELLDAAPSIVMPSAQIESTVQ